MWPSDPESPQSDSGRAPPLYRKAFRILATEIRDGVLPSGTRLTEQDLASRFGISRAPIRQAIALLDRHGLVLRVSARGLQVSPDAADRASLIVPGATQADQSDPSAAARLQSAPSWEPIYAEVEGEIVARIPAGTWRLREAEVARHYRVSRTVARDVIGRLQIRGLIEKDEAGRWQAPALTPERMSELYEVRWLLEPQALRQAAPSVPGHVLALARARLRTATEASSVSGETLDTLEEDLHVTLLGYCPNRSLLQTIRHHQSLLVAHRFLYRWTSRMFPTEPFLPEHVAILDQLAAGAVDEAAAALELHLRLSLARAVARVYDVNLRYRPERLAYLEPI